MAPRMNVQIHPR